MQKSYQIIIAKNELTTSNSNHVQRQKIIHEILEGYDRLVSEFKKTS